MSDVRVLEPLVQSKYSKELSQFLEYNLHKDSTSGGREASQHLVSVLPQGKIEFTRHLPVMSHHMTPTYLEELVSSSLRCIQDMLVQGRASQ